MDTQQTESCTLISVTLLVIKDPNVSWQGPYDYKQDVSDIRMGTKLIDVMLQAELTGNFRFKSKSSGPLGQFVTSVMGKAADPEKKETWWLKDGKTGEKYKVGVSTYVPKQDDLVLFQFGHFCV